MSTWESHALKRAVSIISIFSHRRWYVPTGHCLHTMKGHSAAVNAVAMTCDGNKAISGSSDRTIKIWNSDPESK